MGRKRKKPKYNSAELDQNYLEQVADYYEDLIKADLVKADSEESMFKYIILTAGEFGTTPMKMRKLLITAGVYSTTTSKLIAELYAEGKNVKEIQAITGLKKSSINGYLPYSKVIYNHDDKSVGADRVGLYRKRQKLIKELKKTMSEEALWECFIEYQNFLFHTTSGLPFKYVIKTGRNGLYTKELVVDRREESKTLAWSSVLLAFHNAIVIEGVVQKPKTLGDIRGISYIYPIFYHFGLIQVPEMSKVNLDGRNPKKKGL